MNRNIYLNGLIELILIQKIGKNKFTKSSLLFTIKSSIQEKKFQPSQYSAIYVSLNGADFIVQVKDQKFVIYIFQQRVGSIKTFHSIIFINLYLSGLNHMRTKIFILLLLSLITLTIKANPHPHLDPIISHAPKTYKVNLEDSPQVRWAPIIKDYAEPLKRFMYYFDLIPFSKTFFQGIEWFAKNEFKYPDFVAEVEAVSKLSGYPFERIFFLNFMYEFSTVKACSGIIVRNDEGKIIHGRNLDFDMWELLANLAARIQYYKGGKLLYSVDAIVGSVFTLTAHKPGAFSVEINTRQEAKFDDDFISVLLKNRIPTCWLLKKVVEEESTYNGALQKLKTQPISAPVYFVISGTKGNQGAILERDADKVHGFYQLTDENWFIVQTNYDRSVPDPVHDERRIPAENRLRKRGNKGLSEQNLFDQVLLQFPTLNLGTILTAVMVSADNYHNTTVWYGQNPVQQSLLSE